MYRRETPSITIKFNMKHNMSDFKQIWVTFGDLDNTELLNKTLSDMDIDEVNKTVTVHLTQTETLDLNKENQDNKRIYIQVSALTNADKSIVFPKVLKTVKSIIKEETIA